MLSDKLKNSKRSKLVNFELFQVSKREAVKIYRFFIYFFVFFSSSVQINLDTFDAIYQSVKNVIGSASVKVCGLQIKDKKISRNEELILEIHQLFEEKQEKEDLNNK